MKKLKFPIWFDIFYLILTVGVPIILVLLQAYRTTSAGFQFTFSVFCTILITYVFVKKYILIKYINKIQAQNATLELNYQTGVGDKYMTRRVWARNKLIEYAISSIQIVLVAVVFYLVVWGIKYVQMKIEGVLIFIALLYVVAIMYRVLGILCLFMKRKQNSEK